MDDTTLLQSFFLRTRKDLKYLEIGVREGRSLAIALLHNHVKLAVGVDNWGVAAGGTGRGTPDFVWRELKSEKLMLLTGNSHEVLKNFCGLFDFIYIDGDHSAEGCVDDLNNAKHLLAPGGVIYVDDMQHPMHMYILPTTEKWAKDNNFQFIYHPCGYGMAELKRLVGPTITTFYHPLSIENQNGHFDEIELLDLWKDVWSAQGWTPIVVGLDTATRHPKYEALQKKIAEYPTCNSREFEDLCYYRWLAFAQIGGAVTDYDVFPLKQFSPREFPGFYLGNPRFLGLVSGTKENYEHVIDILLDYKACSRDTWDGHPHISDLHALVHTPNLFDNIEEIVQCWGLENWEQFPLVHFTGTFVGKIRIHKVKQLLGV